MAVTGQPRKKAPAKKTAPPAQKVAAPARTSTRTRARTAEAPVAVVEEAAVAKAAAAVPRPSRDRPAARAAAAMRGEPEPDLSVGVTVEAATPPEAMANPDAAPDPMDAVTPVPFKGRTIMVKLPTPEQLTMYRRLSRQFQDMARTGAAEHMELDEALRQLDRATRLVQSVMADADDREWLEDMLLEGNVKMEECSTLLREAFTALNKAHEEQATPNRAARRSRARLAED